MFTFLILLLIYYFKKIECFSANDMVCWKQKNFNTSSILSYPKYLSIDKTGQTLAVLAYDSSRSDAVTVSYTDKIHISTDYADNWYTKSPMKLYNGATSNYGVSALCMSPGGDIYVGIKYYVTGTFNYNGPHYLLKSVDYGVSWTLEYTFTDSKAWPLYCAVSNNDNVIVGTYNGFVFVKTSGSYSKVTLTANSLYTASTPYCRTEDARCYFLVDISYDGSRYIYNYRGTSNGGSVDGMYTVNTNTYDKTYVSAGWNYVANGWTDIWNRPWLDITMSNNGQFIFAQHYAQYEYIAWSNNFGINWYWAKFSSIVTSAQAIHTSLSMNYDVSLLIFGFSNRNLIFVDWDNGAPTYSDITQYKNYDGSTATTTVSGSTVSGGLSTWEDVKVTYYGDLIYAMTDTATEGLYKCYAGKPTGQPTGQPSRQPSRQPTGQPTRQPTRQPTGQPTRQPTGQPTRQPTGQPTRQPTRQPTGQPTTVPTMLNNCMPGTYSVQLYFNSHSTVYCNPCPAGTYSSTTKYASGPTICSPCDAGEYSPAFSSSCSNCTAGYYSSSGQGTCNSCSAGSYSLNGSSKCLTCPSGKYSPAFSSSCINCDAGYYSNNGINCEICPSGTYSLIGASTCISCNGTSLYSAPGSSSCDTC